MTKRWWRAVIRDNWYRDVWLLVVTLGVYVALNGSESDLQRQREGRAVAIEVTCTFSNAVARAGQATITGGVTIKPREFERALERMGLPPRKQRETNARNAARAYAAAISASVEQETGIKGLVAGDGTIRCDRLKAVAAATPTR